VFPSYRVFSYARSHEAERTSSEGRLRLWNTVAPSQGLLIASSFSKAPPHVNPLRVFLDNARKFTPRRATSLGKWRQLFFPTIAPRKPFFFHLNSTPSLRKIPTDLFLGDEANFFLLPKGPTLFLAGRESPLSRLSSFRLES